ncbi:hypothetical protein ETAA1_08590 [Urbifossiella limnaea]|uniref:Uncharacterized protein n=1 Tax=Urbifossiella limnaea TaxID=2528023 RepID=A0A517XN76_9BACT|nr:hypothetical protein ETAA1_08590 [Urbifossiella limnaea]
MTIPPVAWYYDPDADVKRTGPPPDPQAGGVRLTASRGLHTCPPEVRRKGREPVPAWRAITQHAAGSADRLWRRLYCLARSGSGRARAKERPPVPASRRARATRSDGVDSPGARAGPPRWAGISAVGSLAPPWGVSEQAVPAGGGAGPQPAGTARARPDPPAPATAAVAAGRTRRRRAASRALSRVNPDAREPPRGPRASAPISARWKVTPFDGHRVRRPGFRSGPATATRVSAGHPPAPPSSPG